MMLHAKQYDAEAKLIYSIIVAGKSADFADKATKNFIQAVFDYISGKNLYKQGMTSFQMLAFLVVDDVLVCARKAKTGNYSKLAKACVELGRDKTLDLWTCKPEDLEKIHGIGPKTSRFFIIWIRPEEQYAALDVHVLRWMRANGYPDAPKATPQSAKVYRHLEKEFIMQATLRGLTARELDKRIWEAGAGRTQETALPEGRI